MHTDGIAYVKNSVEALGSTALVGDDGQPLHKDGDMVEVRKDLEDAVQEAIQECPGECIFIQKDK
jgi:ferredoxin